VEPVINIIPSKYNLPFTLFAQPIANEIASVRSLRDLDLERVANFGVSVGLRALTLGRKDIVITGIIRGGGRGSLNNFSNLIKRD